MSIIHRRSTIDRNSPKVEWNRPSISTVTDRLVNKSVDWCWHGDICTCVGIICHYLWDTCILGEWVPGTILHHCWDHRSMVVFCISTWFYVRQLKARSAAAAACDIQSTKSFGHCSDESGHGYQPLDCAILLALLAHQRRRGSGANRVFTQYVRKNISHSTPTLHILVSVHSPAEK